jgi:hypothetical protein
MSDHSTSPTPSIGMATLLGVLFVGLKLCHVIAWPWVWVLAPFWLGAAVVVILLLIFLVIGLLAAAFTA